MVTSWVSKDFLPVFTVRMSTDTHTQNYDKKGRIRLEM